MSNVMPVSFLFFFLPQMLSNSLQPILLAKVVMVSEVIRVGECFFFGVSEWVGERESLPNQPETFSSQSQNHLKLK